MEGTSGIELSRGKVIPDFVLPRCDTEEPFELRSLKPRHNVVLIFAHGDSVRAMPRSGHAPPAHSLIRCT